MDSNPTPKPDLHTTISARVPKAWEEELQRRAAEGDRKRSDEVRRAIRAYLELDEVAA